MRQGSLKEALELKEFGPAFHFLMSKRITDVQRDLHRIKEIFRGQLLGRQGFDWIEK